MKPNRSTNRHCLDCGEPLNGRADKKFCSDLCRNHHNNTHNRSHNNFMRNVNYALRKNRSILKRLSPQGKATIPKSRLAEQGFNFIYFTHTYRTQKGGLYYFCYEYGYIFHNNFVTIVHSKRALREET